jgi:hypothetical protein
LLFPCSRSPAPAGQRSTNSRNTNPRDAGVQGKISECWIEQVNSQQFSFSLHNLGLDVPDFDALAAEAWRKKFLGAYAGYCAIRDALNRVDHCEPKHALFVYRPTLCRRWWMPEHQATCGHVSEAAIRAAMEVDRLRCQKR